MGDVILAAPLFTWLKNHDPATRISFVTNALYRDFFRDDPRLASVVPYSRETEQQIFSDLSSKKWDMIVDLQNNRRSRRIRNRYFRGIKQGLFNKLHARRFMLLFTGINLYGGRTHVVERYIRAASGREELSDGIPPVKLYFDDEKEGSALLAKAFGNNDGPVMALIPFCSWKNKQWAPASYAAVGTCFSEMGWNIALFGGPDDMDEAQILKKHIGPKCYSFAGELDLYQVGSVMKKCTLALGNDTGLSHLARSCGVKTGIIFGATTRHFGFFPYGEPAYRIFQSRVFCRPCHPHGGNFCRRLSRPCLGNIGTWEVIAELKELLQN